MEGPIVLARLMQRATLELAGGRTVEPAPLATLRLKHVPMVVRFRRALAFGMSLS
jgi:hypothetical protein